MLGISDEKNVVRVVIVEDYMLTRAGLHSTLEEYKFIKVIGEFDKAIPSFPFIEKEKPDVVLMDLGLEDMSGLAAIQKIRQLSPDTKIVVLTSHERKIEVFAALGAGANAYCLKDIEAETLVEVIKTTAQGACWLSPAVAPFVLGTFPCPENPNIIRSKEGDDARELLTERELEVLRHLVAGKSNTEIAEALIVSVHTAKAHVCSILQKLCVDDRVQAAVKAIKEKIV